MASPWDPDIAAAIIARHRHREGALLPMLHALQEAFGHVDRAAIPAIAEALNLSRAEVHGVLTFYHDFRAAPAPGRVIRLCMAEACQARGCETIRARAEARLGVAIDAGPGRGGVALETIYCLGNCALGPAALVSDQLVGLIDAPAIDALCDGEAIETLLARREPAA